MGGCVLLRVISLIHAGAWLKLRATEQTLPCPPLASHVTAEMAELENHRGAILNSASNTRSFTFIWRGVDRFTFNGLTGRGCHSIGQHITCVECELVTCNQLRDAPRGARQQPSSE